MRINSKILLIWLICCLVSDYSFGQKKDSSDQLSTAYVVICHGFEPNDDSPKQAYFVIRDLKALKNLKKTNADGFVCSLSSNSYLFEEPFFTLAASADRFNFSIKKAKEDYQKVLSCKIDRMNKAYSKTINVKLKSGKVYIQIVELTASFWKMPFKTTTLYSDGFNIDNSCYGKSYIYNLKNILRVRKLNKERVLTVEKLLSNPE